MQYTAVVVKERPKLHHKHSKSKSKRGHKKKNPKNDEILNGHNSPSKTYSNKNGHVNGTIPNGTESHRHYNGSAKGINHNNNKHSGRNGCLVANEKSKEQSQPENQHIKVS